MNKSFDIIVAKEYETKSETGVPIKKTAWNRVGRAWPSKSAESLSFELYMLPQQRYVIQLVDRQREPRGEQGSSTKQEPI